MPESLSIVQQLRQTGLFKALNEYELTALAESVAAFCVEAGHVFVREGDAGDQLYIISEGSVQVFTFAQDGHEIVLARLEAGSYFGEQALLPGRPGKRNAYVRAFDDACVLSVTKEAFQHALSKDHPLRERLEEVGDAHERQKLAQQSHVFRSLRIEGDDLLHTRKLAAGEIVFHQGDPGEDFYLVIAGSVAVFKDVEGSPTFKVRLGPGQCFGELALIGGKPRQATVLAQEPAEVLCLEGKRFLELYQDSPDLRDYIETLQRVYVLPGRGFATQHAGHFQGAPAITTIYHFAAGRKMVASRVIGRDVYNMTLSGTTLAVADKAELKRIRYIDAVSGDVRELALIGQRPIGVTVWGSWEELGDVHRMILDEQTLESWQFDVFKQRGSLQLEERAVFFDETEILCGCMQVTRGALQLSILDGCATAETLSERTGAGSVCGGCVPRLKEMVGRPDWTPVVCSEVLPQSEQVRSFRLRPLSGEIKPALPGQHIVIQARIDDDWVQRPYTLSSAAGETEYYEITVKREEYGLFSGWMFDHLHEDTMLRVSSPQGKYLLDMSAECPVVCLVAGIGVTPALAMMRTLIAAGAARRLHVDYSCTQRSQFVCDDEFEHAADVHPSITYSSRCTSEDGRLQGAHLAALVAEMPDAVYYLCGPDAYQSGVRALLGELDVPAERIQVEEFTPQGGKPVRQAGLSATLNTEPGVAACPHAAGKAPVPLPTTPCPGAGGIPDIIAGQEVSLLEEARAYLLRFYHEKGVPQAFEHRWAEVAEQIETTGTYTQTYDEVAYGAKLAWRNSARCIGRLYWHGLQVRDMRHLEDPDAMFEALCEHIRLATNGGNLRAVMTLFKPQQPGQPAPRLWNPQLLRYAGYRQADGSWIGDPANGQLTEEILKLGWDPGERTHFDILPIVIELPGQPPKYYPIPPDLILEVPMHHPEYEWFARLGLRWYSLPAVSEMLLDCGGLKYSCAPFNGWYMGTEIGARNFSDEYRYNMLPAIAERLGLDTRRDRTLWKDRALVELNIAVLHSFEQAGVKMTDHHAAANDFLEFVEQEVAAGRRVDAIWSWLVPPMSGSLTPVFHIEMEEITIKPNYFYQPRPYLKSGE
ncbi:MAG: nitric oxide synthase oxygenase [Candidatus Sericytochromatia bacterium]